MDTFSFDPSLSIQGLRIQAVGQVEIDTFAAAAYLENIGIPYWVVSNRDGKYLGVGVGISSDDTTLSDHLTTDPSLGLLGSLASSDPSTIIAMLSIPFSPTEPIVAVVPRLTIVSKGSEEASQCYILTGDPTDMALSLELLDNLREIDTPETQSGPLVAPNPSLELDLPTWEKRVHQVFQEVATSTLDKVVLSVISRLTLTEQTTKAAIARRYKDLYPSTTVIDFPSYVAASPELILKKAGVTISSTPLAGTKEEGYADQLLSSKKDRVEHDKVVSHIVDALLDLGADLLPTPGPTLYSFGPIEHLRSQIEGKIKDEMSLMTIAAHLAPTPAISGYPSNRAMLAISAIEKEPRGLYGGLSGFMDGNGDGELHLTIRAIFFEQGVLTRVGVGLLAESDPMEEYLELTAKLNSIVGPLADQETQLGADPSA